MKKIITVFALLAMLAMVGCGGNGGDDASPQYLTFVNNSNITPTMVAGGGLVNITFQTKYDWYITKNVEWLTASKECGNGGIIDFFIAANPNPTDQYRQGTVVINLSNGKSYDIVVTQEPNDGIQHLVCQDNEILYTTKFNYIVEKDFLRATGFGESESTYCVEHKYIDIYGKITFNNDVTKLPDNAFENCASLEVIYLPNGVKSVGKNAFKHCSALHSIISINSVDNNKALVVDGCLCAVAHANLVEYTIPAGVTKIGAGAFSGCKTLKRVVIPEGVVEIEAGAFEDCENLKYLEIPNSLTLFGDHIFTSGYAEGIEYVFTHNHPNLLTYTTHDNQPIWLYSVKNTICKGFDNGVGFVLYCVPEVFRRQFMNCTTLKSVTIPEYISSIGEEAFYGCWSLTAVYCKPTTPPRGGDEMFYINPSGRKIYVPRASVDAYKRAEYWSAYADDIVGYDF